MAYLFSLVTLFAALLAVPLHAQTAGKSTSTATSERAGNTTDPVSPLIYRSTFDTYRAQHDAQLLPWRDANDRVGAIGGWRFYAREAQQGNGPSTGQPTPAPAPASTPQHKH